jgi:putative inorganic carbon (HCO3(-)) transporter
VRFLQLNINSKFGRWVLTGVMILCAVAALGSQSRGALLAVSAMAFTLWWRGKNKIRIGIVLLVFAAAFMSLMPEEWYARMSTINAYESDRSAMGRISAWWNAWNIAWKYPIGVGLNPATPELFLRFSPYPDVVLAAHSIYFQVMGNHGFLGLFLFMAIWYSTWRAAGELRTQDRLAPETRWTADLGAMCQVSLVGYAVGGAFLSLAYFDLPYDVMIMVVLTRLWVQQNKWQSVSTPLAPQKV